MQKNNNIKKEDYCDYCKYFTRNYEVLVCGCAHLIWWNLKERLVGTGEGLKFGSNKCDKWELSKDAEKL